MMTIPHCYNCGANADLLVDDGSSAICYACEDNFQAAMAVEYPLGQCQQCGVAYRDVVCEQGKTHVFANHVEGACSAWSDGPDYDAASVAAGYCGLGCKPLVAPDDLTNLKPLPF